MSKKLIQTTPTKLFVALSYYINWYTIISLLAAKRPLLALLTSSILTSLQLLYVFLVGQLNRRLLIFITVYSLLGLSIDLECQVLYLISFTGSSALYLAPLWPSFAVLVYFLLQPLFSYRLISAVLACVGFPLTYYFGSYLGAATIHTPFYYFFFGLVWAVMFPTINGIFQDEHLN